MKHHCQPITHSSGYCWRDPSLHCVNTTITRHGLIFSRTTALKKPRMKQTKEAMKNHSAILDQMDWGKNHWRGATVSKQAEQTAKLAHCSLFPIIAACILKCHVGTPSALNSPHIKKDLVINRIKMLTSALFSSQLWLPSLNPIPRVYYW